MNLNLEEAHRWLAQARHDAEAAALNAREGYAALACFLAQQAAEKALKAYLYAQGERAVIGHATYLLLKQCQYYDTCFEALQDVCRRLDQYYIPTRYPNGLPGGIPHEVYTSDQADQALEGTRRVLDTVTSLLSTGSGRENDRPT
jgi:HEPN domain-containing protein